MGIFSKKFDICVKDKELKSIVTNYSKVDVIKINAKLDVPNDYEFVIGKKGKVLDRFNQGEHYFTYANLPIMCRKYGFDKMVKGQQKREISANLYFVSKAVFAGKFETYKKVEMGTRAYGFYKTKLRGVYSYKVKDSKEFMQSLLNEYDYIKTGEAEKMLEYWVSEHITKELEANNFILSDIIANSPNVAQTLKSGLSKFFSIIGLELLEFKITKYILPKQYQDDSDRNIQKQNLQSENEDDQNQEIYKEEKDDNLSDENSNNEWDNNKSEIQDANNWNDGFEDALSSYELARLEQYKAMGIEQDAKDAQNLLKEFGIIKNEEICGKRQEEVKVLKQLDIPNDVGGEEEQYCYDEKSDKYLNQNNNNKVDSYVPFGSFIIEDSNKGIQQNEKNKAKEKTFVDLTLSELYTTNANTKRCLNCGAENKINARHCILCGDNFNEGDI